MTLYIETSGSGSDIVLLHGWAMHGGVFQSVVQSLSKDYRLHCVDLPGHGYSPLVAAFSLDAIVARLEAVFPLPVHVLGWSLGGLIAQHWAWCHPEKVHSVMLVSTSPCFTRKADWPHAQEGAVLETVAVDLQTDFKQTLQRFFALQTLGVPAAKQTLLHLQQVCLDRPPNSEGLLLALQLLQQADIRQNVPAITCPAGLFFCEKDRITPIGAGKWLQENLLHATLYPFSYASHAPFLSHEAEFIMALRQHLEKYL